MGGLQPAKLVPAVSTSCATSVYADAISLSRPAGENISSRTPSLTASDNGLGDDTQLVYSGNALAHRGVLRGTDLWIGYNCTADLVKMWAQLDNCNVWLRKFTAAGGWGLPINVTNVEDKRINVRGPRIFGTPKSSTTACPTGNPADPSTTDATLCQNTNVIYLGWGTQENVSPCDPDGGDDLGIYITASLDGAASFLPAVRYSTAMGSLFQDDESAYEAQIVTRPDDTRVYGVWNQAESTTGIPKAEYASAELVTVADPVHPTTPPVSSGGALFRMRR